jgi:hypothetical protein
MIQDKNGSQQEEKHHPEQILPNQGEEEPFHIYKSGGKFIDKAVNMF